MDALQSWQVLQLKYQLTMKCMMLVLAQQPAGDTRN